MFDRHGLRTKSHIGPVSSGWLILWDSAKITPVRGRESIRRIGGTHAIADYEIELPSGTVRRGGSEVSQLTRAEQSKWRSTAALDVRLLGTVDFDSALFLQERFVYEISGRDDRFGALLLCEHPPLITVGRAGSRAHILMEPKELAALRLDVRWLNRGGGCLVHAPGQLAVYPLVPLDRLGLGLRAYREHLIGSVLDLCRELGIPAWPVAQTAGVAGRGGQFAFLGAATKRWVAYQGLFVNVHPLLTTQRLVTTGTNGQKASSLEAVRGRVTAMSTVRESLIRNLTRRLGYAEYHVFTGHPLLKRTRRVANVYA
jgi:lipoyl(octanoyl) transferase